MLSSSIYETPARKQTWYKTYKLYSCCLRKFKWQKDQNVEIGYYFSLSHLLSPSFLPFFFSFLFAFELGEFLLAIRAWRSSEALGTLNVIAWKTLNWERVLNTGWGPGRPGRVAKGGCGCAHACALKRGERVKWGQERRKRDRDIRYASVFSLLMLHVLPFYLHVTALIFRN